MTNTDTAANEFRTLTFGQGAAVHTAYFVGENVTGSLCDPSAYSSGKRYRLSDAAPTCKRCERATDRRAGRRAR